MQIPTSMPQPSKSYRSDSEADFKFEGQSDMEHARDQRKHMSAQKSTLPIVGSHKYSMKNEMDIKSEDNDVPRELLSSILPPQNTPGEFMHDPRSPFDTCSESPGHSAQEKTSPMRNEDANPPRHMPN